MKTAPSLKIDLASPESAYEQIATGLRTLLVAGEFRPGAQLPTVRQFAMDLGVHHNTVAEAYRILAQEGWLDLKRRRGATVVERPGPRPRPKPARSSCVACRNWRRARPLRACPRQPSFASWAT